MPDDMRHWDEAERLAVLRRYDILDTQSEGIFGDFVQIAAQVCNTPIAVVNLIDENRQWFAAEKGLGVRETPLDISICAHAIFQSDVFVIPDLSLDHRFDCNPLVVGGPHLRFYGGALLESPEGLPLGTICVLDYQPRPDGLSEQQVFTLKALSRQVMAQLELRRLVAEKELLVQEAHHRVKNSLQMIQSLLTLQARSMLHEEAAQQLRESAGRVQTFSAMHEHLYQVGDATDVNLADYLRSLIDRQETALATTLEGRRLIFTADRVLWPAGDAPTVGLIVFELITNALKYGQGAVSISVQKYESGALLTVEDEGQELPADFEPLHSKGLGMRVVTGLLKGRRGRLEIDRSRGHTCFVAMLRTIPTRASVRKS